MSKQNDGGPAFPHWNQIGESGTPFPAGGGMALRDWFAGQALAAIIPTQVDITAEDDGALVTKTPHAVSVVAYGIADAMLKAREEPR